MPIKHAHAAPSSITIVTYRSGADPTDTRWLYELEVLRLVLEKTARDYGEYSLVPSPQGRTSARELESIRQNRHVNHMRSFAVTSALNKDPRLAHVAFPIYLGAMGYRICFVSPKARERFGQSQSLRDLQNFRYAQGVGWQDIEILRDAGLQVREISRYESLFRLTAISRVDLFCRGLSEYHAEWIRESKDPDLHLDEYITLFYPFPRFFYTHASNKNLVKRISEGLDKARQDGSFQKLWQDHHEQALSRAKLPKRRLFILKNRALDGVTTDYQRYFFKPGSFKSTVDVSKVPSTQNKLAPLSQPKN